MNDFFGRPGLRRGHGGRQAPTFRDSLAELRDRLRDGLADAASRAVADAVRRAAGALLGGEGEDPPRLPQPRGCHREGWDDAYGYDPGGWHDDDPWRHERLGWGGRDGGQDADDETQEDGPGPLRRFFAVSCQAAAAVIKTLWPGRPLGWLACAVLAALALILGGGQIACEAGLALAEAAWAIAEMIAAEPEPSDR